MGLLKIPLGLFASLVGQVSLENVKQINSLLLQFGKLRHWNTRLASGNVPVHALNEHLHNFIAGIRRSDQPREASRADRIRAWSRRLLR